MPSLLPSALSSLQSAPGLLEGLFPHNSPTKEFPIQLQIAFGTGTSSALVAYGNTLSQEEVASFPATVNFVGQEGKGYTLVLQDPDAPIATSPTSRSFLHLIKPNLVPLPASALDALGSSGVDVENPSMVSIPSEDGLMRWKAPGPGKGTGKHRYVFLLLEQPTPEVSFSAEHRLAQDTPEARRFFNVEKFIEEDMEGAKVVGVNWFVVEAEEAK